ncbi:MAG: hypothetical protein E7549_04690 [Ruminococcaceae bacterium]|nr:hypothetical protein [Oscillospiraceae bacterium]
MKRIVVCLLALALAAVVPFACTMPLSASGEENVIVNVYDAQGLGTYLETANVDIVLWNNVTFSDTVTVQCHSIDLNGYQLHYNSTLTLAEGLASFSICDSIYSASSETNTGSLTALNGVNIADASLIIESGIVAVSNGLCGSGDVTIYNGEVTVNGTVGVDGEDGKDGKDGVNEGTSPNGWGVYPTAGGDGHSGTDGTDGGHGIQVANLYMYGGNVSVTGGRAGNGGNGGKGGKGGNCISLSPVSGGDAGHGGDAGLSGAAIVVEETVVIYSGTLTATGGDGGSGGDGGNGGNCTIASDGDKAHSYSGDAGNGGDNSHGGEGILAKEVIVHGGTLLATGGNDGKAGAMGVIGDIIGCHCYRYSVYTGKSGVNGTFYGYGGAGINADTIVNGGSVAAVGGTNAAGIGGSGYAGATAATNVVITGGTVTAEGSTFDIGSGYDGTSHGTAATLEMTGGVLEFATYGRATNVSTPVFQNCTVTGAGAYQHEGTYNADGKFTVTVDDILVTPEDCVGYDAVTVTATVRVSRTSNLTTPAPRGHISFKLDGKEFTTAKLTNAVAADGVIAATATTEWIAVEGEHRLSAVYVSGTNDKYAADGTYAEASNIAAHEHDWNEEYTVDVPPTCTVSGSKSIHCRICDTRRDFAEVEATGHDYVDNQCQNCGVFLPLVVFKDYDGTVLGSEYYYLGDTVREPATPSRAMDNTYIYVFAGWDSEVTECDGDKVYTAVYNAIFREYTVTFKNYDGSLLSQETCHYGDVPTGPAAVPQKVADKRYEYTFAGWDTAVVPCNGNATYTALYDAEYVDYTVTFKNDNGVILSQTTYHYGDTVTVPARPSKAADVAYTYTFDGWDKLVTSVSGDAVYTATYKATPIEYTVVFKNWNGNILSTQTYRYGDGVIAPSNPTRMADNTYTYTFAGWDKAVTNCAGDETYTATYTSHYVDYTVVFKDWNGEVLSSATYHWGEDVMVPADPTRAADNTYNYTFNGWDKTVVSCAGNATYTATYSRRYNEYTVVFKNWNGEILSSRVYGWGDRVSAPATPQKEADEVYTYTFAGWDKTVVSCAGNATYTATYTPVYIDYTVVFKNWDGAVVSEKTYHWDEDVTVPADPTRASDDTYNYTFNGWDKTVVNCAGDAVYTATYTRSYVEYTVVFKDWDGETISSRIYYRGEAITVPPAPFKAADNVFTYTFGGWDTDVVNCAGDATYTATYVATYIEYTVAFKNENGTVLSEETYHFGDTVTEPATPQKDADEVYTYTFAGWDKTVVNCAGNATYTATYTRDYVDYTVMFKDWNGEVLSEKTYHFGDAVTAPNAPVRAADNTYTYMFDGWGANVVNCAGDAVYTATYVSAYINYTVEFKDWDGTALGSGVYHFGDTVTAPANPIRPYDDHYIYNFAGWNTVVVACEGNAVYTATYDKTAIAVASIAVTTKPNKVTYLEGEAFDPTGMVVMAYYNNDTHKVVTDYTFSGYDTTPGDKTVTVTYGDKSDSFTVTVKRDALLGDVDGSGTVDSTDARMVLQYAVKKIGASALNVEQADVDGNGTVDSTDARLILQYAVKKIDKFPAA